MSDFTLTNRALCGVRNLLLIACLPALVLALIQSLQFLSWTLSEPGVEMGMRTIIVGMGVSGFLLVSWALSLMLVRAQALLVASGFSFGNESTPSASESSFHDHSINMHAVCFSDTDVGLTDAHSAATLGSSNNDD